MWKDYPVIPAAAVQAAPVFMDKDGTIEKARAIIKEAAASGAKLIVFPETFIPAYPYWGIDYAEDLLPQMLNFAELSANAVEVPGPDLDILAEAARAAGAYVVMGLNERDPLGGTLYNTSVIISDRGELIGRHRKLVPTVHERIFWGRGDGSDLRVFETGIGRVGSLICYEHHMPLSKMAMFLQGEQIHCALWPGWPCFGEYDIRPIIDSATRQYAFEGGCFVVAGCMYIEEKDVPDEFFHKNLTRWDSCGGASIVSPLGSYLAGPAYGEETILYAELDFSLIALAKAVFDSVGHYARWDVTALSFNPEANRPVRDMGFGGPTWQLSQRLLGEIGVKLDSLGQATKAELEEIKDLLKQAGHKVRA